MTPRTIFIIAVLAIISVMMLVIRALPILTIGTDDPMNIVSMDDPMYNLRLIEWSLQNGLAFPKFDPMSFYPYGQLMPWGPMFTWIAALFPLVAGASTRTEIITASLWAPPVIATLLVPVTYLIAQKIWDWKAGLFSALFIAFVGGQFFFRSYAGYLDHHVAEVLFGAVFALLYTYAIWSAREWSVTFKSFSRTPLIIAALAGLAYVLGYLNMPTMVLFAIITMITTTVIAIMDYGQKRSIEYLIVINGIVFGIAGVVSLAFTSMEPVMGLTGYTIFHPITYLIVIVWTVVLYAIARRIPNDTTFRYVTNIAVLIAGVFVFMLVVIPGITGTFINGLITFFGFNQVMITIQEARSWSVGEAWSVYNFGMVLMAGGFIILLTKTWLEKKAENVFVLVWSVFIIVSTFRQVRYEYYLAMNIALLSGVCLAFFLGRAWPHIISFHRKAPVAPVAPGKRDKKKGKHNPLPVKKAGGANVIAAVVVLMFAVAFIGTSASTELSVVSSGSIRMNQDWREALEWMKSGTPGTGVDSFMIYDNEGDRFTYPDTAYGVMSWWDYGHMITYIGDRIPNANPFQVGVAGPYGAARFFMTSDENDAARIADTLGVRYVVTDIEMATGKMWAMATWYNSTAGAAPYTHVYFVPASPGVSDGNYNPATIYTDEYYRTVISRLHNFDGSMVTAAPVVAYLEYKSVDGAQYPLVTKVVEMSPGNATAAADQFNRNAAPGTGADVGSPVFIMSTVDVPALNHFRLVHESPTNVFSGGADVRYVKVFEYVPGFVIPGEGVIETVVTTNTGRQFTWRTASEDGKFVVPYPGRYVIMGTGEVVEVPP